MRLHIALDDALVEEIDRSAGPRRRSAFIAELLRRGLGNEHRRDDIGRDGSQAGDGAGVK